MDKYKLIKRFMDVIERNRIKIINELGYEYENMKPVLSNCVAFLHWVDKMGEWEALEKKVSHYEH